jgi:hypothetical protein
LIGSNTDRDAVFVVDPQTVKMSDVSELPAFTVAPFSSIAELYDYALSGCRPENDLRQAGTGEG